MAHDSALVAGRGQADKPLRAGDFLWIDRGAPALQVKNTSDRELRLVVFTMKPLSTRKATRVPEAATTTVYARR